MKHAEIIDQNKKAIAQRASATYVGRGQCLIINQLFENDPVHRRNGTKKDEIELKKTFEQLGCNNKIMIMRDLTKDEMIKTLHEFRLKVDETMPDFMVVIILSHGKRNLKTGVEEIMDINMIGLPISKVKNMFIDGHKCPSMIGKPKLFFIQACRGQKQQVLRMARFRYLNLRVCIY